LKKKILIIMLIIAVAIGIAIWVTTRKHEEVKNDNLKIVTSFYPIHVMTANITQNVPDVELVNMTEANVGCLHDYTISTTDMKKIEKADIYIQNGLGLESFMDKIISAYPELKVIDTSADISNKIQDENETNPHIWTSIENYIKQVETICQKLCEYDNKNAETYKANCESYLQKINQEKQKYENQLQKLNGAKAICLNEGLEYLLQELKMQVTQVETNHEESTMSAETLKNLIEKMKNENIKIIVVDKDDNIKNAETLANETGAKIYKLDSGLTGETNNNAYIDKLEANFLVLESMM